MSIKDAVLVHALSLLHVTICIYVLKYKIYTAVAYADVFEEYFKCVTSLRKRFGNTLFVTRQNY